MTPEERLQAILRRAERGRSYGRLMMSSKDLCLDDVIRLAREGLEPTPAPIADPTRHLDEPWRSEAQALLFKAGAS